MKNTLTTFVLVSLVAGTAMADEKRKMDPIDIDHSARSTDCNNPTPFGAGVYAIASGEAYYFSYTGNGAGINFTTCGGATDFDTDVRVYDDCSDLTQNFYRDGSSSCGWATYMNCADYTFVNGQNYLIVITGYNANEFGLFEITMNTPCPPPPAPPVNDLPANALPISVGDCVTGNTTLAVDNTGAYADTTHLNCTWKNANSTYYSSTNSGASRDVFYSITVPTGNYSFDLVGSGYDTVVGIWDANNMLVAGNDDWIPSGTRSKIECCRLTAGTYLISVDGFGSAAGDYSLCVTACASADADDLPAAFELGKAFPNPFNPSTTISFTMGQTAQANLTVYNMNGQTVATLVDGVVSAGAQSVVFDASELTSGVYFYTLNVAGQTMTEKMVLVK